MSSRNTILQLSTPNSVRNFIYYITLSWSCDNFVYVAMSMGSIVIEALYTLWSAFSATAWLLVLELNLSVYKHVSDIHLDIRNMLKHSIVYVAMLPFVQDWWNWFCLKFIVGVHMMKNYNCYTDIWRVVFIKMHSCYSECQKPKIYMSLSFSCSYSS